MGARTQKAAETILGRINKHRAAFEMESWHDENVEKAFDVFEDGHVVVLEDIENADNTCGTTLCIAGFAALEAGWKQKFYKGDRPWNSYFRWIDPDGFLNSDGPSFRSEGAEYMDLTEHQSHALFYTTHDNDLAISRLERLAAGEDAETVLGYDETGEQSDCTCDLCIYGPEDDESDEEGEEEGDCSCSFCNPADADWGPDDE